MPRSGKTRRVFDNDDAWIMAETAPPLTPEKMWSDMIGPHEGSPVDALLYSIGGHDVYDYETDIGLRTTDAYAIRGSQKQRRRGANLRSLVENHGGPMAIMTEQCHRLGIDFFPSMRMNEHYDIEPSDPSYGRFRLDHPDWTIGRGEDLPKPSMDWGVSTGLDFAVPEVRTYIASIVLETIERWDVDGLELDFFRHPTYFNIEEAYSNRYLMTDMVRHIRGRMDEIGEERGKGLDLMVRVPATIERCEHLGLDIREWIAEGLIDLVVAGGGMVPIEMPMREFVEVAEGTGTLIYGCLEAYRPAVEEMTLRAIAARYWDAGVDGLYLFNFYSMPQSWKRDVLGRLYDKEGLRRLDKMYDTDDRERFQPTSHLHFAFLNAIPRAQLPVTLRQTVTGNGVVVEMDIAEQFDDAKANRALGSCSLGLLFEHLSAEDEIEVLLNSTLLDSGRRSSDGWTREFYEDDWNAYPSATRIEAVPGETIEFDVSAPPLQKGVNEVEVRLASTDGDRADPVVLKQIRVWVRYR